MKVFSFSSLTDPFEEAAFDEDEDGPDDGEVKDEEDNVEVDAAEVVPRVERGRLVAGHLVRQI